MADVYLGMNYRLEVSEKDMRLICLSLSGKLKRPEDVKAAVELNVRICKAQQIRINEQINKIDGALRAAEEAHASLKSDL
jgi:hypothetical protein